VRGRIQGVFSGLFAQVGGVQITVNGKPREVSAGTTIAALLADLELPPPQVAVEVNLELIPRGRHAEHRLAAGDRLEVVTLVGGG
jgi:sulfur carrier protein